MRLQDKNRVPIKNVNVTMTLNGKEYKMYSGPTGQCILFTEQLYSNIKDKRYNLSIKDDAFKAFNDEFTVNQA